MGQESSSLGRLANSSELQDLVRLHSILNSGDESEVKKLLSTIGLLYASSKARIYSLADKLACSEVCGEVDIVDSLAAVEIPVADSWNFRIGDWVRIKYTLSDFRVIQKQTLGWSPRLRTIHSCDAVVTKRWSQFSNEVTIYTPSRLSVSTVYAGVLEKVQESERKKDKSLTSRWRMNEYVRIQSQGNEKTVDILQKGLDKIPTRYMGRRGRIIAVTRVAIVVTFNERTSYDINSALLTKSSDQSPLVIPERKHKKGYILGQKVKVGSNIRELVNNQKGHGGWSDEMTKCVGKEVTIVHICKDGNLMVEYKTGDTWRMNSDSVCSQQLPVPALYEPNRVFRRGDIVKIRMVENIRALMRLIEIPSDFLEYLRCPAKVTLLDDDFDYLITYNGKQNVNVHASTVQSVTAEEKTHHDKVKSMVKEIKVGSSVVLDVGPPTFVNAVLRDSGIDHEIITALTAPCLLKGYDSRGKAVIEYTNGKRYTINSKYLTVPDKFNM